MKYPLASSTWGSEELAAIQQVIDSQMFTSSKYVKEYEKAFADFFGSKYAVMVNSGSSANLLATAALFYRKEGSLKRGDEVIVPAVSWATTYAPLYQYGLKLKFVDIDINTLNYDLTALEDAISDSTKMIVAVNLLGNSNDFNKINKIINNRNIIVIEDNCESMGAKYNDKFTGTIGLVGTFSTFFSHHMATMEGGAIVTDDEELYHILLSLRSHGWTRDLPEDTKVDGLCTDPFQSAFHFILPGYNVRPIEMEGAIGLEQLKKLPTFLQIRKNNAKTFQHLIGKHPHVRIQKEISESSWFGFALIFENGKRNEVAAKMCKENIDCRPIVAGNFVRSPVIEWYDYEIHGTLTNADYIHDNGLFVGNHQFDITDELHHLDRVLGTI